MTDARRSRRADRNEVPSAEDAHPHGCLRVKTFDGPAAGPEHRIAAGDTLAVGHLGRDRVARSTVLTAGDSLLLPGPSAVIASLVDDREMLMIDAPDRVRRQAVPIGARAKEAVAVHGS